MNVRSTTRFLTIVILFASSSAFADEPNDAEAPPADGAEYSITDGMDLSDLNDPGFEQLVNFELLGIAIANGDASGVADVAMQLAHAEDTLLREHATLKSAAVLSTALSIAKNGGDKVTLARLGMAAKMRDNKELAKEIDAASMLGGASRAIDPPPQLSIATDPAVFAEVRDLLNELEVAENAGDRESLAGLLIDVRSIDLQPELADWINKRIEIAIESSKGVDSDHAEAMSMLAGGSRRGVSLGSWSPPSTGVPIRSPFAVRPTQQSNLGGPSGLVPNRQPQQNRMQRGGYRTYNDVKMEQGGRLRIGGQTVQARRGYNPQTNRGAWVYKTKKGGTIVQRDGDSRTYVRPGSR